MGLISVLLEQPLVTLVMWKCRQEILVLAVTKIYCVPRSVAYSSTIDRHFSRGMFCEHGDLLSLTLDPLLNSRTNGKRRMGTSLALTVAQSRIGRICFSMTAPRSSL
ncbi:uncharacterized protein PHALS_14928 [Plasmopara halstedii]|uniref:Uncharacterized protein n=1 Tax=Plasmopara halstedii TaxID=4781 RepID=A0A0P1AWB0_PLAHL|nr:uncharacterized protein PHALS_14928 [Plasmopara halstedii]CEG46709.1 hypothetical protein PHALS_14928 [Plasmopara halstedii]|eukprot:XP_024583078.1 hypothetical protein PHALS_14928 [Plasmopara halstedii]